MDIHDLGLAREAGTDVVGVAAVVDRPLAAVIARGRGRRPRDLEGRTVGVTGLPSDDAVLRAVVESDGGDFGRVRRRTIGFAAVASLVSGRVDAATAFWNAEGVVLRRRGVEVTEFRVGEFGAPAYPELVLAVRGETLRRDRNLVIRVVAALGEGTAAALADREAAVADIARVSGSDESLVRAQLEAVAPALPRSPRLDREALEAWAAFDVRFGILGRAPDLGRAFDVAVAGER